jgi:peptidoglycan lytic transglycosylase
MVGRFTAAARVFAIVLTVAAVAACARFPLLSYKSTPPADRSAATQRAALKADKEQMAMRTLKGDREQLAKPTFVVTVKPEVFAAKRPVAAAAERDFKRRDATYGLASFYGDGSRTASGERFNPRDMTAAHRDLPFGTRVRVTELASGKSVTVRINDRGPFVPGRIVDVSQSAAEKLGMIGRGVAKVKLDVVTD